MLSLLEADISRYGETSQPVFVLQTVVVTVSVTAS